MATWKKVVVSGSSAALSELTLDTALAAAQGGTGLSDLSSQGGKILKVNSGGTAFVFGNDSSEFSAAGISGSLGANATLIRTLTAAGISGSLGANAAVIRTLTKAGISGSFTATSSSIAADIATNVTNIATNASDISNIGSFTAAGISGSLGANATLIRTLTAAGISGSLGANAAVIRTLTKAGISGSFTATSSSIAADIATNVTNIATNASDISNIGSFTAAGISGSLGANATLIRTLTAAGISGSSTALSASAAADIATNVTNIATTTTTANAALPKAGGTMTGAILMGNQDITGVKNLEVGGNLNVAGTASFTHSTNLAVADKYILLNSGSTDPGNDDSGGIVIQGPNNGVGQLFGFQSGSFHRWGLDSNFNADTAGTFSPEAFMSAVLKPDTANTQPAIKTLGGGADDAGYNQDGNIYVSTADSSIWIYS